MALELLKTQKRRGGGAIAGRLNSEGQKVTGGPPSLHHVFLGSFCFAFSLPL